MATPPSWRYAIYVAGDDRRRYAYIHLARQDGPPSEARRGLRTPQPLCGPGETVYTYGRLLQGDVSVMGDWTGNGVTTPGIVRDGVWHLRDVHAGGPADQTVLFPAP